MNFSNSPFSDSGNPKQISTQLSRQIVFGLLLIGILASISFFLQRYLIERQRSSAAEINVSGRQRMLSQRTALLALQAAYAPNASKTKLLALHAKLVLLMQKSHIGLVDGNKDMNLPGSPPPWVAEMYFGKPGLDKRVRNYITTHQSLGEVLKDQKISLDNPLLSSILDTAPHLLKDLHRTVGRYVDVSNTQVDHLQSMQAGILGLIYLLILLEGLFLFRPMVNSIVDHIKIIAKERRILQRQKNAMQLVLDNMGDGIITLNYDGTLRDICSSNIYTWFGNNHNNQVQTLFFKDDSERAELLEIGLEDIKDNFMPFDIIVSQMNRRITMPGGVIFEFIPKKVSDAEGDYLLFLVEDITSHLMAARLAAENQEFHELVGRILEDPVGFREYIDEIEMMIKNIEHMSPGAPEFARRLHTIKGNSAIFGMQEFSVLVHEIESEISELELKEVSVGKIVQRLQKNWKKSLARVDQFIRHSEKDAITITRSEHKRMVHRLEALKVDSYIIKTLKNWANDPVMAKLQQLAIKTEKLSVRIGKPVQVKLASTNVRLPRAYLNDFWPTLIHVIRNSIDHGIEKPEERVAIGKSEKGCIEITCTLKERIEITISDDGPGINWSRLREKHRNRGHTDYEKTEDLLFVDGLSSKDEVSQLSGRGIGLSEVKQYSDKWNGKIEISTQKNQGTTFLFSFPVPNEDLPTDANLTENRL